MSTVLSSRPRRVRPARRALLALVAALGALGLLAPPAGAQEDTGAAARHGAAWLAEQVEGGLPLENFGSGDWGVTLDAALGLAATGTGGAQLAAIWEALLADRDEIAAPFGDDDAPGRLARMILLARALGEDPRAVGEAPGADLIERLEALRQDDGPDAGLFGSSDSARFDGAFRQGFSLIALSVAGGTVHPSSIGWLEEQQCVDADDGAWMPYRADLDVPCAFDAEQFVGPDSNSTAIALAALAVVAPGSDSVEDGLEWLLAERNDDGGWGFYPDDASEPSSTAFSLQVLLAFDAPADVVAATWTTLVSFQLGCDAPEEDRGALTFPGSNDAPNLFSTSQALPALAGVTLDAAPGDIVPGTEPLDCSGDPSTPSAQPTVAPDGPDAGGQAPGPAAGAPTDPAGAVAAAGPGDAGGPGVQGAAGERQLALTGLDHGVLLLVGGLLVGLGAAFRVATRRLA